MHLHAGPEGGHERVVIGDIVENEGNFGAADGGGLWIHGGVPDRYKKAWLSNQKRHSQMCNPVR
jgi:hypothetical protein